MTLMRFDPFRDFDRIMEQNFGAAARMPRSMPMAALRRGDTFLVELDVPGVGMEDIELTVERNVVTIRARRTGNRQEGDEVLIDERPYGEYSRQLFLGDNLDPDGLTAHLQDGVLQLTIPVSEASKPRQIPLDSSSGSTADSSSGSTADSSSGSTAQVS